MKKLRNILFALLLLLPGSAFGDNETVNLTDCDRDTVQDAINNANDNDTIVCPYTPAAYNWNGPVTWSKSGKRVHLKGSGAVTEWTDRSQPPQNTGATYIYLTSDGEPAIYFPSSNSSGFEISGFTFESTTIIGEENGKGIILIEGDAGDSDPWRIHHNNFYIYGMSPGSSDSNGGNGIMSYDHYTNGLVDHNYFRPAAIDGSQCMHSAVYYQADRDNQWYVGSKIQTGEGTVFIEDNYGYQPVYGCNHLGHIPDVGWSARYVLRHNEIHGQLQADSHGYCYGWPTREWQISENNWYYTSSVTWATMEMRGATGVVYGNRITASGSVSEEIWMDEHRGADSGCNFDYNSNCPMYATGYDTVYAREQCPEGNPCMGEVGTGQNRSFDPVYIWDNKTNGVDWQIDNEDPSYIVDGVNYHEYAKSGYTEFPYPHYLQEEPPASYKPTLLSPSNGATAQSMPVHFSWTTVSGATVYNIQIDDDRNFSSPEVDTTTFYTYYDAYYLDLSTKYWWRVRAGR